MIIHCKERRTTDNGRSAFTLIELLVVISIIILLAGLLLAAVMRIFVTVDEARVSSEIAQLNTAVESFKITYGFYPPSQMTLAGTKAASDQKAQKAIGKMFTRINWTNQDWNGDGSPDGATALDGAQCLVFFLSGPGGGGFSTNPNNPTAAGGDRIAPFGFKQNRLVGGGFPRYVDIYGQPYLYFSSNDRTNGYTADCSQLSSGAYSYSSGKYANPTSFQIISAGRDSQFGNGSSLGALPAQGKDNLGNMFRGTLGSQ